jgi:DNA-binding MarR family transcriptional regulator
MPGKPPTSNTEYEILADFRYALRRFLHFSESAARKVGLTPQQHQALLTIRGSPGGRQLSVGELAERLQIRHHSAVGLVDRLEDAQLIRRSRGADDRRKVYLALTGRGARLIEQLSALHREELRLMAPQLRSLIRHTEDRSAGRRRSPR